MNTSALIHMICQQSKLSKRGGVVASEVARWMDVSKPTAMKELKRLTEKGVLEVRFIKYRSNSTMYIFVPSIASWKDFRKGEFKGAYDLYVELKTRGVQKATQMEMF